MDLNTLSAEQRATLVQRLQEKRRQAPDRKTGIAPRADRESLVLSGGQQRLWLIGELEPENPAYNITLPVRLNGDLDVSALERALSEVYRRHEVLRLRIGSADGKPSPSLRPPEGLRLERVDLLGVPEGARDAEFQRRATRSSRKPFDLGADPLLRASLFRMGERTHVLLVTVHHIAFDGWSWSVLAKELAALYAAFREGRPSPLADLPVQFFDYAEWLERRAEENAFDRDIDYHCQRLSGDLPTLSLPTDRPRPSALTGFGGRQSIALSSELTAALKHLSQREGASLFMTLLAAFNTLLHRYSGQDDVLIGTPIANRPFTELEFLIGFFVNTLAVRTDLSGDPTFRELLGRVRERALETLSHPEAPFDAVVGRVQPVRQPNAHPLFQVAFAFQNVPQITLDLPGIESAWVLLEEGISVFDLTLFMWEREGALSGELEYSADLFRADTIARMVSHFTVLLEGIAANPDRRLSELPLLSGPERRQLLVEWNDTHVSYPRDGTVHGVFRECAKKNPDAVAVVCRTEKLTYAQLDARSDLLARRLRAAGVRAGTPVGLLLERSLDMIVATLAILKAGGAYVPFNPAYPGERLAFMLEDTGAPVVLTQNSLKDVLDGHCRAQTICLDGDWAVQATPGGARRAEGPLAESGTNGSSLAYVMYTSGSTGKPKGAPIPHRGILRLVLGATYARFGKDRVFLQLAPVSFDAATFEIWGALLHGAKCVLYPGDGVPDPRELRSAVRDNGVTTLWLTASLFNAFIDESPESLAGVDEILTGGEALSVPHIRRALELLPETRLINGYGPTENTTFTCTHTIPRKLNRATASIPIGRPIANTQVYVLDAKMQPVPIGIAGELYIGGDGLAPGYLNREELTAARFVANPFSDDPDSRLYATGDLVRYLPDGAIDFLGRIDTQVKIRGFRIELGEIEAAFMRHPAIREVVATVRDDAPGEKRLLAYLVAKESPPPAVSELLEFVRQWLPDYMIPWGMTFLDALPLTANGKVDRRALPAIENARRADLAAAFEAPRNEIEQTIAAAWQDVLRIPKVGIHDNFFELGGHSLLAARVIARLREAFKLDLPLRSLFEDPTVAGVARNIRYDDLLDVYRYRQTPSSQWRCLVPMQPRGDKLPFFLVSGAHANEDEFMRFLSSMIVHIGLSQPVYGFRPLGLDGKEDPHRSVEEMAAAYIEELMAFQSEGPYLIGGECIGGIVAYEMAQQLARRGERVDLLFLMDTPRPHFLTGLPYRWYHIQIKLNRLWRVFRDLMRLDVSRLAGILRRKRQRLLPVTEQERIQNRIRNVEEAYIKTLAKYAPKAYPGKVTFLVSEELSLRSIEWRDLVEGGMEVHTVPGNHVTRLTVYGKITAGILVECLARAHGEQ